jgi:hypothetical protein
MVFQELCSTVNKTCFQQISSTMEHYLCKNIEDLQKESFPAPLVLEISLLQQK